MTIPLSAVTGIVIKKRTSRSENKKFVVLHHSILSEGINVKGLEAALFMRNMDYITISQTIGRVIRLGNEYKTHGKVCEIGRAHV